MNNRIKTTLVSLGIVGVALAAYLVYAATLIQTFNVLDCAETDGGFNYVLQGTYTGHLNDTNQTPFNVTDFCIDNATVGEYVCGSTFGPQYNNTAALFSENCTALCVNNQSVANCTGSCSMGACV